MKTIAVEKEVAHWWDGKVVIDEVKTYRDKRGSLTEVWRTDDDCMNERYYICHDEKGDIEGEIHVESPQMCYMSMTNGFVMRGPHQHVSQVDYFYTFHSRMSYHLFNPETNEMRVYITNPNSITRVKVAPPIIHSYRNLQSSVVQTANFPTSLFMGPNKQGHSPTQRIDEIRWEHKVAQNKTYIVLGAGGRLGRSLTKTLFKCMDMHQHHVIPVYDKIQSHSDLMKIMGIINEALVDVDTNEIETKEVVVINCAAYTNVQKSDNTSDEIYWVNSSMPCVLASYCEKRNWKCVLFSTDYVYKKNNIEKYTSSKQQMEDILISEPEKYTNTTVLRIANLFSDDKSDVHNIVHKFKNIELEKKEITINPSIVVFPSDVDDLSKFIHNALTGHNDKLNFMETGLTFHNLIPSDVYSLRHFCDKFYHFDQIHEVDDDKIKPWHVDFIQPRDKNTTVHYFEGSSKKVINTLEQSNGGI